MHTCVCSIANSLEDLEEMPQRNHDAPDENLVATDRELEDPQDVEVEADLEPFRHWLRCCLPHQGWPLETAGSQRGQPTYSPKENAVEENVLTEGECRRGT